jgi:hypothetical protein
MLKTTKFTPSNETGLEDSVGESSSQSTSRTSSGKGKGKQKKKS